jgi:hypothetical protein
MQYCVDQWQKIEGMRLQWQRNHQRQIRADKYINLIDAEHREDNPVLPGRQVLLAPSLTYSPRWYTERYQDTMAIVRKFGKPDLFITMTCNPKWEEISQSLGPGETAADRPDVVVRVFYQKLETLMEDLIKKQVLGKVIAHCEIVEFQKRGLPHAHILLILKNADKPHNAAIIDTIISAEIPNKERNPRLFELVTKHNLHGPCGDINPDSPCMEASNGRANCTKQFPKEFKNVTTCPVDSYPIYRRRDPEHGGERASVTRGSQEWNTDNRWVVPYNPYLTLKYQCHINVECVNTVQTVKYLYKYLHKGPDRVNLQFIIIDGVDDEITRYVNGRYVSTHEALFKLYGLKMHSMSPNVVKLPCHLDGHQNIMFDNVPQEERLQVYLCNLISCMNVIM